MTSEPALFARAVKARAYADEVVGPYRPGLRTFVLPKPDGRFAVWVETGPGIGGFATWPDKKRKPKRSKQT